MGGIPFQPLLENFLFIKFCMAMEILKCSDDELSPKNYVLKNNRNLDWLHCKHLLRNPPL